MQEALHQLLSGDAGIAIHFSDRINWSRRPQEDTEYPACMLTRVSSVPEYHSGGTASLASSRVQVDTWAETYEAAALAARAIKSLMSGYSGTVAGVGFQGCFLEGERDFADEELDANRRLFRVSQDFIIWHTE